jgi:hypothetical protein
MIVVFGGGASERQLLLDEVVKVEPQVVKGALMLPNKLACLLSVLPCGVLYYVIM